MTDIAALYLVFAPPAAFWAGWLLCDWLNENF